MTARSTPPAIRLVALVALAACDLATLPGPSGTGTGTSTTPSTITEDGGQVVSGMLTVEEFSDTTNSGGIVKVKVDVTGDVSSLMVTGESSEYVSLEQVRDPNGDIVLDWQDWWTSSESLTNAFFGFDKATAFNWPVRQEDGPLAEGTWTIELSTIDGGGNYAGNTDIDLTVHTKDDDDLKDAAVTVAILWADGIEDQNKVVNGVEDAVERWREVWAQYGLELVESYQATDLDPTLGFTYSGSNKIEDLAEDLPQGSLVLVVGEQVMNGSSTFGVSGGIPGSLAATPMTFVVLSWITHAGTDGAFDDDEIRLMGETMAHEVGHYTGLYHPVEADYQFWDALEDTEQCTGWTQCDNALGRNLMYPYPICSFSSCNPQDELTADQQGVAHRYTGAL